MATSLSVELACVVSHIYTNALDNTTPEDSLRLELTDTLANGTGTDQVNAVWHDRRTLSATSETLDLTGLTDPFGTALAFTGIKLIAIHNRATTTAFDLAVGGAASTIWSGCFANSSDILNVGPNGLFIWLSPTDAEAVTADYKSLKLNSGANAVTYDIVIYGTKA